MILERTLPQVWALTAADVPALAGRGRDRAVLVPDVERLCSSIVVDQSRSDAAYVARERSELYDSLGFLLGQAWLVFPDYDPTRGRAVHDPYAGGFKGWFHLELTRDLIDHWRSWYGRYGQKRVASTDLEVSVAGRDDEHDGRSFRERRSRGALATPAGDRRDAGADDLGRLLESGDRAVLREVEALGLGSPAGAGGRAAGADRFEPLELVRAA